MPEQLGLFEGLAAKRKGQDRVESNNQTWVDCMRSIAIEVYKEKGEVCIDDLRTWADDHKFYPLHPNAWGSVFRGKNWVPIGYRQSSYPSNRGHRNTVWRYQEPNNGV